LPYTTIKDNVVVVAVVVAAVADVDAVETFNQVKCPHTHTHIVERVFQTNRKKKSKDWTSNTTNLRKKASSIMEPIL